jgi:hypothetical protein
VKAAQAERLAIAVVHFGLSPSEFRGLTVTEWNAMTTEWNRAHKR